MVQWVKRSSVATGAVEVAAVAWTQSLAKDLSYAMVLPPPKKQKKKDLLAAGWKKDYWNSRGGWRKEQE